MRDKVQKLMIRRAFLRLDRFLAEQPGPKDLEGSLVRH